MTAKQAPKTGLSTLVKVMLVIADSSGTEYASSVKKALESGESVFDLLKRLDMPDPDAYRCTRSFAKDYGLYTYLRKFEGGGQREVLTEATVSAFIAVETKNLETNRRLRYGTAEGGVEGVLSRARRKISRILGRFSIEEFLECCGWSQGATASIPKHRASIDNKLCEPRLSVTPRCLPLARFWLEHDIHWLRARLGDDVEGPTCLLREEFQVVDHSVFDTVDKDFKSRRTIDKQPTLNMFFQKGVDKMIRRRLLREGVDLRSQKANQEWARIGIEADIATLDLKDASNTNCVELVNLLLADSCEWLWVLNATRCDYTVMPDGARRKLELFSSMGNGFTFSLETLIFYALCWAVKDEANDLNAVVAVYGDDIIVQRAHAERVLAIFHYCGFTVNDQKSFIEGPFRESCGKHYLRGQDVTPVFQKKALDHPASAIRAANRFLRWAHRVGGEFIDASLLPGWQLLHQEVIQLTAELNTARRQRQKRYLRRHRDLPVPYQPYELEGDGAVAVPYFSVSTDKNGRGAAPTQVK